MDKNRMMLFSNAKRRKWTTDTIAACLILLWVYAALSKLLNYEESRSAMLNQVFPVGMAEVLVWAVPVTELIVAGLLIFAKTNRAGLYASLVLLCSFTIYITIVMTGMMGSIPCSCGGILESMTWGQHLLFNVLFIVLTLVAIIFSPQHRLIADHSRLKVVKKGGYR